MALALSLQRSGQCERPRRGGPGLSEVSIRRAKVLPLQRRWATEHQRVPITAAALFGEWDPSEANTSSKAIFQHPFLQYIDNLEVMDARDAMETCTGLRGEAKNACYMQFGCDPRGVETYLTVVEGLESSFQQEPDPVENCWRIGK